jgi:predicted nucleic acid-binding protein
MAKEQGYIPSVKRLLDELIAKAKFRVNDELYYKVITTACE